MMELSKLLTLVLIFSFPSRVKARIPTSMWKETQKDVKVKMRGWELVEI